MPTVNLQRQCIFMQTVFAGTPFLLHVMEISYVYFLSMINISIILNEQFKVMRAHTQTD
jgi:hypothetical protein